MTDQQLLELAAKAASLNIKAQSVNADDRWIGLVIGEKHTKEKKFWNPLTDDGDALRLAVKLNLIVGAYGSYTSVCQTSAPALSKEIVCWYGSDNLDPYAATRRAIVRAAAEIGKTMEVLK